MWEKFEIMGEKFLIITFILAVIVAIPIGIYFLIKSELRKRSSISLLEIIVIILLAVIFWLNAIEGLRSNPNHFAKFIFIFMVIVLPISFFYVGKIRHRDDVMKDSSYLFSYLSLFFILITFPSIFFLWQMFDSQTYPQDMPTLHIDEPFKVWHALYLFILAWFIKHFFYGEKKKEP